MEKTTKDQIFSFIETYISKPQPIVVGVSGGPDSMLLVDYIQKFYKKNMWEQDLICVAHFNHGQRIASKKDMRLVEQKSLYNTFYYNTNIPKKGLSETKLRKLRHIFFEEVIEMAKAKYLFLGHNLTDRIETTLLNIVRGCGVEGLLSIKPYSTKKTYTILRPLINIPKSTIQHICGEKGIPYSIDETNTALITPRNVLRNNIIPDIQLLHSGGEKNWYISRDTIYTTIQNTTSYKKPDNIQEHTPHPLWGATHRYIIHQNDISYTTMSYLFAGTRYITKKTILDIKQFALHSSGHLYIGGWYIFTVGKNIHCINGKKDFWKHKYTLSHTIQEHGKQEINGYTYTIPKQYVGYTCRYPKDGDTYKKKRLLKVMLNKKIPVFMRNTTPIIVDKNGSIISILY